MRSVHLPESLTSRALLDAQSHILERMADDASLAETLDEIAKLIERLAAPALCSIMGMKPDGLGLVPLSSPSLPPEYMKAASDVPVGPMSGSCGTAAFRKEAVIVTDIATDPLWEKFSAIALPLGLRACWSLPIFHTDGSVLGTVALYYGEPRAPSEEDLALVSPCMKLIRLAIISNRKEMDLRMAEARWRIGADALGIGTYDADPAKQEGKWSTQLRHLLGVGPDFVASYEAFLGLVLPEDRELVTANMPNYPNPPFNSPWHHALRIRRPDTGQVRTVLNIGCALPEAGRKAPHIVGALVDVTEHHAREQQLQDAKAAAEAANIAKSKFLASMSHELRTPLNAIIGFSDMIKSRVFGPLSPARYEEYVEDIHQSGTHLLSLINDVLDMAKIEAQRFELHRTQVLLSELADSALLLVRPQAIAKGVRLELDIPPDIALFVDGRAMRQVLINFLSNAVKFTNEQGMVRLFSQRLADGGLSLGVEDSGAGMDEEGIATALEPFGQVAMDIASERAGTGLGLPIAKALIEYHNATFHIASEIGAGTRIWGEFPAQDVSEIARRTG